MSDVMCIVCKGPTSFRDRETIANVLHSATLHCATQDTGWAKRFTDLVARLAWVEGELRNVCGNCILAQLAAAHGDTIAPPTPAEIERRYLERNPFLAPRLRLVRGE